MKVAPTVLVKLLVSTRRQSVYTPGVNPVWAVSTAVRWLLTNTDAVDVGVSVIEDKGVPDALLPLRQFPLEVRNISCFSTSPEIKTACGPEPSTTRTIDKRTVTWFQSVSNSTNSFDESSFVL